MPSNSGQISNKLHLTDEMKIPLKHIIMPQKARIKHCQRVVTTNTNGEKDYYSILCCAWLVRFYMVFSAAAVATITFD